MMTDSTPDHFCEPEHRIIDGYKDLVALRDAEIVGLQGNNKDLRELALNLRIHLLDQQEMPDYPKYSDELLGSAYD